jgi:hypothetical protein
MCLYGVQKKRVINCYTQLEITNKGNFKLLLFYRAVKRVKRSSSPWSKLGGQLEVSRFQFDDLMT